MVILNSIIVKFYLSICSSLKLFHGQFDLIPEEVNKGEKKPDLIEFLVFQTQLVGFHVPGTVCINPNIIGVQHSLIVLGGGFLHHVSVLTSLLVKKKKFNILN